MIGAELNPRVNHCVAFIQSWTDKITQLGHHLIRTRNRKAWTFPPKPGNCIIGMAQVHCVSCICTACTDLPGPQLLTLCQVVSTCHSHCSLCHLHQQTHMWFDRSAQQSQSVTVPQKGLHCTALPQYYHSAYSAATAAQYATEPQSSTDSIAIFFTGLLLDR